MQYFDYKDHTIYPTPRFNTVSGNWKIQLTIRYKRNFNIFTYNDTFDTKSEAVFNCIKYGKKLIDEGIELIKEAV